MEFTRKLAGVGLTELGVGRTSVAPASLGAAELGFEGQSRPGQRGRISVSAGGAEVCPNLSSVRPTSVNSLGMMSVPN